MIRIFCVRSLVAILAFGSFAVVYTENATTLVVRRDFFERNMDFVQEFVFFCLVVVA